ncbi:MAG: hypothetical protein ACRDPW_02820, partial [Mycobacteriales bacterium]
FQPSVPGSLEQAVTTAMDAVAAFRADQQAQRAKLAAAFRRLWAERVALLAGGRVLTVSEQARLGEIEQSMASLVNLVHFGQLAAAQLDSAEHSIHSASQDLKSAVRAGAADEISASVAGLEATAADAELVGASTGEVADTAHTTAAQTDAQITEWSKQQLESLEAPAEVVAELENLELPAGLSLSNAKDTGEFDLNVDQRLLDSVAPDAKPASPEPASLETASPETAVTPKPPAVEASAEPDPAPKSELLAPPESAATEDQPELAHPDDVPPLDDSAEPVPTPDAGADAASRLQHLAAGSHAAGGELPKAHTLQGADAGGGLGTSPEASQLPSTPVVVHSARAMSFQPGGEEGDEDGGGGGTAASMGEKNDDRAATGHIGEVAAPTLDAAQVARDDLARRRVTSTGNGQYSTDADDDTDPAEPVAASDHSVDDRNACVTPLLPAASVKGGDGARYPDPASGGPAHSWQPVYTDASVALQPPADQEPAQPGPDGWSTSGLTKVAVIPQQSSPVSPASSRHSVQAAAAAGANPPPTHNTSSSAPAPTR